MDFNGVIDNEIKSSALELIGNTPIVALDRLYTGPGRILAKCEFMNPGGSIKCRSSLSMIQKAVESKELMPGGSVVEVTSGNQGCGLAVVCAVLGHPLTITMPKGNSVQRAIHMEALGTTCIRVPQVDGKYGNVTARDVAAAIDEASKITKETNAFFGSQLENKANLLAHYETTGPEIWRQTGGHVDVFVTTVGTGGTFSGTTKFLKEKNPNLQSYVVEPEGSEPIKGDEIRKPLHLLQGSGYGSVPPLFDYSNLSGTIAISDELAVKYKKLIGEKEGLYVGYTSGANVAAAVHLLTSKMVPKDSWVVTVLSDTGLKYGPIVSSEIQ